MTNRFARKAIKWRFLSLWMKWQTYVNHLPMKQWYYSLRTYKIQVKNFFYVYDMYFTSINYETNIWLVDIFDYRHPCYVDCQELYLFTKISCKLYRIKVRKLFCLIIVHQLSRKVSPQKINPTNNRNTIKPAQFK